MLHDFICGVLSLDKWDPQRGLSMLFSRCSRYSRLITCIICVCTICLPSQGLAEFLAVKVPIANIRSGPGENQDLLWKVEAYHPLQVIEKNGKWYHFKDFEGDEGWVHFSLVQKMDAVITAKENCNIRSGPGTKYDIVFTAEKGIPFKVLKNQQKWIKVEHADGDTGWIYNTLVWPNK